MNAVSENLGKAVDKVNSGLKSLGAKVGNINVPVKVNVVSTKTNTGYSVPGIHVETKPIKELGQKFSGKGTTKGIDKGKNITDYRKTFFDEYPHLEGRVVVHHAIEQQILKRYPNLFSHEEIHALENLRGIPKDINNDIHLLKIRRDWDRFYRNNPNPTKEEVINYMIELDKKYGEYFNPPVKR